jgi:hypothetical protein
MRTATLDYGKLINIDNIRRIGTGSTPVDRRDGKGGT